MNAQLEERKRELLLGAGNRPVKGIVLEGQSKEWSDLTTLDISPRCNPDVIHDLNLHPLPFLDDWFDEIHAYEVLEHLGSIGDYEFFFREWSEYWRILKPGGWFFGSVPKWDSPWAWGDPSHRRIISRHMLTFLSQDEYEKQVGITSMTDFRDIYKADFEVMNAGESDDSWYFCLQALKNGA